MSMTEEQVRAEWGQSGIGRDITSSEIANWTQHGSSGQLVKELGGGGRSGGGDQSLGDLVNGDVSNETGQQLVGWRHPESGEVSPNASHGFGAGSIPIWGRLDRGDGYKAAADEGARVYDTGFRGHGTTGSIISVPTADWDNKADNPWVKNITKNQGDRFHMLMDDEGKPRVHNGRYMFEQARHQGGGLTGFIDKALGTNINHFLNETLPSDLGGAIAFAQGPASGIMSGSEWAAGSAHTLAGITGMKDEEVAAGLDMVGTTAAAVAGTVFSGGNPYAGAAAAAAYQAVLGVEQHVTNDSDFDWGQWAESSAQSLGTAGFGNYSGLVNAGINIASGDDWQDVGEDLMWSTLANAAAGTAEGGKWSTAGLTRSSGVTGIRVALEDDPDKQVMIAVNTLNNQIMDRFTSDEDDLSNKIEAVASN